MGGRVLLAILGAVALASCVVVDVPRAEIPPALEPSGVEDRHKDHVHRPPTPN